MDLTYQVPMQYYSLQHWTLLLSPVTSTTGCCFYFGSIPSFFLELFLHWSPVAYWAPTDLESSSFSVLSFCLFTLFMGILRQEYWSGLPFRREWKSWLKAQHSENEDHGIWSCHFMANRWENSGNSGWLYFWGALKSLQMVIAAMKLKDAYSLKGKLWST